MPHKISVVTQTLILVCVEKLRKNRQIYILVTRKILHSKNQKKSNLLGPKVRKEAIGCLKEVVTMLSK